MKEDDAKDLAVRAVRSAMRRDSASGEDIMVVVITKDKYEEHIESGLQKQSVARPTP
jgi:proteasome beta subunit